MFPLQITGTITAVATGASTATAIPNDGAGNRAAVVYITVEDEAAYVRAGESGDSVTNATGIHVTPGTPLLMYVSGQTHIIHLQGVAGADRISIAPVDNGPYQR
tara:strand:+ start:482 stop:793 length:312 start_codon:yes stop_codon:yes gene_type:complete